MIISHKHKFIFIHCPKTGGSSVTVSFARYMGARDIQIGGFSDTLKKFMVPNIRSLSRLLTVKGSKTFVSYLIRSKSLRPGHVGTALNSSIKASWGLGAHASAQEIKNKFPKEWENYYKFCIIRNPYDRMVSQYFWQFSNKQDIAPSFSDYIKATYNSYKTGNDDKNGLPQRRIKNWPLYTINNKVVVDYVVEYKDLIEGLQNVCQAIGLDWDGWLPRAKGSHRKHDGYRSLYNKDTAKMVYEMNREEIDHFNYKF